MVKGGEVGVLASYKELRLGGPNRRCAGLKYEAMETLTKQRKLARKENGRGMEEICTRARGRGAAEKEKEVREQPQLLPFL